MAYTRGSLETFSMTTCLSSQVGFGLGNSNPLVPFVGYLDLNLLISQTGLSTNKNIS